MKSFFAFFYKEVLHILRDHRTLLVIFGMPVVQILIFGFALSNEVKNTRIAVLDQAQDHLSTRLLDRIYASAYFESTLSLTHAKEIDAVLRQGRVQAVIVMPANFASALDHQKQADIQVITDGTNPNLATTLIQYISNITRDFEGDLQMNDQLPYTIVTETKMLFNPQMKGEYNFVPGVIALILMLICTMMTSVSIVREKEMGNMEILLVSPMHPLAIIVSKALPYLFLSLIILTIILVLSVTMLSVPILGSIWLLYGVSLIFITAALALGLLISSLTNSQQMAMMISLMGLLLPTIMFSGFMFPIESMPLPLRIISNIIPAKWYFFSIQGIMIKGLGISSILKEILILTAFCVVFLTISVRKFKIRLA